MILERNKMFKYLFGKSSEEELLKNLSNKFIADLCRPGIMFSYLGYGRYYGAIHIFGDNVRNRYIIFSCTGKYKEVIKKLNKFIEEY